MGGEADGQLVTVALASVPLASVLGTVSVLTGGSCVTGFRIVPGGVSEGEIGGESTEIMSLASEPMRSKTL